MIERVFDTLYSWIHKMVMHSGVYDNLNTELWPECTSAVIKIENIMVNLHEENVPIRISMTI